MSLFLTLSFWRWGIAKIDLKIKMITTDNRDRIEIGEALR